MKGFIKVTDKYTKEQAYLSISYITSFIGMGGSTSINLVDLDDSTFDVSENINEVIALIEAAQNEKSM